MIFNFNRFVQKYARIPAHHSQSFMVGAAWWRSMPACVTCLCLLQLGKPHLQRKASLPRWKLGGNWVFNSWNSLKRDSLRILHLWFVNAFPPMLIVVSFAEGLWPRFFHTLASSYSAGKRTHPDISIILKVIHLVWPIILAGKWTCSTHTWLWVKHLLVGGLEHSFFSI